MDLTQPARTVAVTARSRSRFARLRLHSPGHRPSRLLVPAAQYTRQSDHPCYDADLSMELLGRTCELPDSKRDLIALPAEYRHALCALVSQAKNNQIAR